MISQWAVTLPVGYGLALGMKDLKTGSVALAYWAGWIIV